MTRALPVLAALACAGSPHALAQSPSVALMAAGSLKEALTDFAAAYQAQTGVTLSMTFGPSGLLRQRLQTPDDAAAASVSLFISADMAHPEKLAQTRGWQPVQTVLQNRLCVLALESVGQTSDVLSLLLDPAVRVGISTPQADPAGDYAWALFGKADALQAGSTQVLRGKALPLTGGPQSPQAPAGRNPYAWVMQQGGADVFVTYCTNAQSARRDWPALKVLAVPEALQVSARYGMTWRFGPSGGSQDAHKLVPNDATPDASNAHPKRHATQALALALMQADAQAVFARYGFAAP